MIILITGATRTGKTTLAQRLMVKYEIPYLSIDHLKMGLIRSGLTSLTPEDDEELTAYLWPIVREIIRTAIENGQSLIIEGGYIPARWFDDFDNEKRTAEIRCFCLIMTEDYIKRQFDDIKKYANIVEKRIDDSNLTKEMLLRENAKYARFCREAVCTPIVIFDNYSRNTNIRL